MIVAIESSSTDISIALGAPDGSPVVADGWTSDRRQGHELLPRLLDLLASRGVAARDVEAVAVGIGPGSFTGLRVGMSIAKGFALGTGCPVVGVPSLEAWLASVPGAVAAVGRAGARDAYVLRRGGSAPEIVEMAALAHDVREGPVVAPGELAEAFGLSGALPPAQAATAVLALGVERLAEVPSGDDIVRLEPAYLRAPRGVGQLSGTEGG